MASAAPAMMPCQMEHFFTGATQAGRELKLFYEHTAFDHFVDHDGVAVSNPAETKITGTLEGAPIDIEAVSWDGAAVTVRTDQGTFTAVAEGSDGDHREALKRYREHRPQVGWTVTLVSAEVVDDKWHLSLTVGSDRVSERIEWRLDTRLVDQWLEETPHYDLEEVVVAHVAESVRREPWEKIQARSKAPTETLWGRHPQG
jgi:hypothetical protein